MLKQLIFLITIITVLTSCKNLEDKDKNNPEFAAPSSQFTQKPGVGFPTTCNGEKYYVDNRLQQNQNFLLKLAMSSPIKSMNVMVLNNIEEINHSARYIESKLTVQSKQGVELPNYYAIQRSCHVEADDDFETAKCDDIPNSNVNVFEQVKSNCRFEDQPGGISERDSFGYLKMQDGKNLKAHKHEKQKTSFLYCNDEFIAEGQYYEVIIQTPDAPNSSLTKCQLTPVLQHTYFIPDKLEQPIYAKIIETVQFPNNF